MDQHHIINDKPTIHGDIVHYTDQHMQTHAALIKKIYAPKPGTNEPYKADLHVFSSENASDNHIPCVPHNALTTSLHSWHHKPESEK